MSTLDRTSGGKMGVSKLKQLFCLLLAAVTLVASSHHLLCSAGMIACKPCQTQSSESNHSCSECTASQSITKTNPALPKTVLPALVFVLPALDMVALLLLDEPQGTEMPVLENYRFSALPQHHYLRDLAQSIPIRGPSLRA